MTYTAVEAVALAGCSYRQFDYWRRAHAFGHYPGLGSGNPADGYDDTDVRVARCLARISTALGTGGLRRVDVIADAVRESEGDTVGIRLSEHVTILVDLR